jgi:hypothetical protein
MRFDSPYLLVLVAMGLTAVMGCGDDQPQCSASQECVRSEMPGSQWACRQTCSPDAGDAGAGGCPSGTVCQGVSACCSGTACSAVEVPVCVPQ